ELRSALSLPWQAATWSEMNGAAKKTDVPSFFASSTSFNKEMQRHVEVAGEFDSGGFADGAASRQNIGDHRARDAGVPRQLGFAERSDFQEVLQHLGR